LHPRGSLGATDLWLHRALRAPSHLPRAIGEPRAAATRHRRSAWSRISVLELILVELGDATPELLAHLALLGELDAAPQHANQIGPALRGEVEPLEGVERLGGGGILFEELAIALDRVRRLLEQVLLRIRKTRPIWKQIGLVSLILA
jgi:hypothetical protein